MQLILCTNNEGKINQYKKKCAGHLLTTQSAVAGKKIDAQETGTTFRENSLIKIMEFLQEIAKAGILLDEGSVIYAEDSGLVIKNLKHIRPEYAEYEFPGVFSKRWLQGAPGGKDGDIERNAKIIEMAAGLSEEERQAEFKIGIAFGIVGAGNHVKVYQHEECVQGHLPKEPRYSSEDDDSWFGFDPIFIPEGKTQTLAEMPLEERVESNPRDGAVEYVLNFVKEQKNKK